MKKTALVFFILFATLCVNGQESKKIRHHELGLTFYDINSFGLTYRIGNEKALWRFNSLFAGSSINYQGNFINTGVSYGVGAGREWRKPITEKLDFRYGADLSYRFSTNKRERENSPSNEDNSSSSHSGEFNFVVGFNYNLNQNISIGAEVLPYAGYSYLQSSNRYTTTDSFGNIIYNESESSSTSISGGLQNNSVLISLVYKFTK